MAKRVDQQALVLCASPAYLRAHGTPRRLEDLAAHARRGLSAADQRARPAVATFASAAPRSNWRPCRSVRVNETEGLREAVKLGLGICQLPDLLVDDELARGELVELLPTCRPESMPIHVVYPSGRLMPSRVRVAIDTLAALRHRVARSA